MLSIIITNYNTSKLTKDCLQSINQQLSQCQNFDVWVIDNNSSDNSRVMLLELKKTFAWLHIELLDTNTGFAFANNVGIKKSRSKYVLLLNSDTYLIDDSLLLAVEYLESHKDVFGCGCSLLDETKKPGVSYGDFPTIATVFKEIVFNKFCQLRARVPDPTRSSPFDIDFPCGAFFAIRREYLEKIGLLDETFFMYSEETDLALRAKRDGYKIKLIPHVKVVHLGGGSSCTSKQLQQQTILYSSWKKYMLKNYGRAQCNFMYIILRIYLTLRSMPILKSSRHYKVHKEALFKGWNS